MPFKPCEIAGFGECCFGMWQSPGNPDFASTPPAIDPEEEWRYDVHDLGVCTLSKNDKEIFENELEVLWDEDEYSGLNHDCPYVQGAEKPPWKE